MRSLLKLKIVTVFFLLFALSAHAQMPSSIDGIEISAYPLISNPGETVTVSIESYVTDLNSAPIVWIVGGKNYAQGTGLKSIGVNAPDIGKSISVTASILTIEGGEIRKSVTIKSGSVDLIWESDGFTPPFYRGKALFAYENTVRIVAMPHISSGNSSEIDPRLLVYKWKKNDKVVQDQSGYGKQTLVIKEDIPRPLDIEVEVMTKDGSQKGIASFTITPGNPSISFYEENPLYGTLYNKALNEKTTLSNQEITIRAIPYSFSINPSLTYVWSVNNLEKPELSVNQSITLRTKGDTEGNSAISLEIKNARDILQGARSAITVFFSKKTEVDNVTFQ